MCRRRRLEPELKPPEEMTVAEWNEFAKNCKWAVIEPAYKFESEEKRVEFIALIDELFGDESVPSVK